MLPEVDEPVVPLVPELLVLPDAPMPEVPVLPDGAETEPLVVPDAEPMPEAEPDVVPVALQAASAATQRAVNANFNIINSPVFE